MDRTVPVEQFDEFFGKLATVVNKNKAYELEYRVKLSTEDIIDILKENYDWYKTAELEQSVNFIYSDNRIARMVFVGGKVKSDYYIKTLELSSVYHAAPFVSLKLATEKKCGEISYVSNTVLCTRIKNRISIPFEKFRIDITQINTISGVLNIADVKNNRIIMFGNMGGTRGKDLMDKFIAASRGKEMEMEIEFTSHSLVNTDIDLASICRTMPSIARKISYSLSLSEICSLTGLRGDTLKSMLTGAKTLSKNIYMKMYPPIGNYITKKADGFRSVLVLGGVNSLITHNEVISHTVSDDPITHIIDCEAIPTDDGYRVFAFDIMYSTTSCIKDPFEERLVKLVNALTTPPVIPRLTIELKQYLRIDEDMSAFKRIKESISDYPDDGYILTVAGASYEQTKSYKIKSENTIDFMAINCDNAKMPVPAGKHLYALFSGINNSTLNKLMITRLAGYSNLFTHRGDYGPIQFSPANHPNAYRWVVDDKMHNILKKDAGVVRGVVSPAIIVELLPIFKNGNFVEWKFIGTRPDRLSEPNYFGNNFTTVAEVNWFVAQDPIILEDMHMPPNAYFAIEKSAIYKNQVHAVSYVKSKLIKHAKSIIPNTFVLDLAAGNGQDLARYMDCGYTSGLFIDIDRIAIATLIERRYQFIQGNTFYSKKAFKVNVGVEDLTVPNDEIVARFEPYFTPNKPGLIVCNLAIHYLIYDVDHLNNFAGLIIKCLANNGTFMFTCFNGKKIHNLFKNADEWVDREGDIVKYHIKKLYAGDFLGFEQKISVKLPFSAQMYEENLVNVELVTKKFSSLGFNVTQHSMSEYLFNLSKENANLFKSLNQSDKFYLDLYHCFICTKI
jgi:SAM-dependent methyltransferase